MVASTALTSRASILFIGTTELPPQDPNDCCDSWQGVDSYAFDETAHKLSLLSSNVFKNSQIPIAIGRTHIYTSWAQGRNLYASLSTVDPVSGYWQEQSLNGWPIEACGDKYLYQVEGNQLYLSGQVALMLPYYAMMGTYIPSGERLLLFGYGYIETIQVNCNDGTLASLWRGPLPQWVAGWPSIDPSGHFVYADYATELNGNYVLTIFKVSDDGEWIFQETMPFGIGSFFPNAFSSDGSHAYYWGGTWAAVNPQDGTFGEISAFSPPSSLELAMDPDGKYLFATKYLGKDSQGYMQGTTLVYSIGPTGAPTYLFQVDGGRFYWPTVIRLADN